MRFSINIILLFCLAELTFAQSNQKIQILDKETSSPVSYATIVNIYKNSGVYADVNGYFTVESLEDTLLITCIGYSSRKIVLKSYDSQDIIYLNPEMYNIDEIVIKPTSKEQKIKHLGYDKYKPDITICNAPGAIVASYIPNNSHLNLIIEKIIIPTKEKKRLSESQNIQEGYFRLHLYTVNQIDSRPEKELLTENLVFKTSELERNIRIDISDHKVLIPKEGIFVGIEWLGENENNTERRGWRPFLIFTFEDDKPLTWTKDALTNNKWELMDENNYWNNHYSKISNATFGLKVKTIEK